MWNGDTLWLQAFLKYGLYERTKTREEKGRKGKGLICFKFSQKEKKLEISISPKPERPHKCVGLIESVDSEKGLNSGFALKCRKAMSWVFLARCTTLSKYFLQQRGHNKVKTNLKSCFKDRRKRYTVCNSCLHIHLSASLNPDLCSSSKNISLEKNSDS